MVVNFINNNPNASYDFKSNKKTYLLHNFSELYIVLEKTD